MPDRLAAFFAESTARRLLLVVVFMLSIWLVHDLLVFFLFFAAFVMLLKTGLSFFHRLLPKVPHQLAVLAVVTIEALSLGLIAWLCGPSLVTKLLAGLERLPDLWQQLSQSSLFAQINTHFPNLQISEWVSSQVNQSFSYAKTLGHALLLSVVAFVVAIVYVSEEQKTLQLKNRLSPASLLGTLARWWGHLYDGVTIMIRTQILIALANAILTLPILLLLGMPQIPTLTVLVFLSGLVPVLGNVAMGILLSLVAYATGGLSSTLLLLLLTVILHKLESYYINPRFATKYIAVSAFVIVISLLVWEQLLGLKGVFISLPFLYLWQEISREWQTEARLRSPSPEV